MEGTGHERDPQNTSCVYSQPATQPGVVGALGDKSFLCEAFAKIAAVCFTEPTLPREDPWYSRCAADWACALRW